MRQLEKQLADLKRKTAVSSVDSLLESARQIKGVKVLASTIPGADRESLRQLVDSLRQKLGSGVVIQRKEDLVFILTNRHVVDSTYKGGGPVPDVKKMAKVRVAYVNEQSNPGTVVWIAPDQIDLALVTAHAPDGIVEGIELDDFSRGKIDASVEELTSERDTVADQGMI